MARKLTEEERNTINLLTAALVSALPAHLRSHAGTIASSLVRIPREVVTMRDVNRIVGRCGENKKQKDELREAIRECALEPAEPGEDGAEAFVLRLSEAEDVAEAVSEDGAVSEEPLAEGEKDGAARQGLGAENAASESSEGQVAEEGAAAETDVRPQEEAAAEKPARRPRRRRRVGDKAGLKQAVEESVQAVEAEATEGSENDGSSAGIASIEGEAADVPAGEDAPEGADAVGAPAGEAVPEATADAPAPAKKRRRTRRSRKKANPAAEAEQVTEPVEAGEPVPQAAAAAEAPADAAPATEPAASNAVAEAEIAPADTENVAADSDTTEASAAQAEGQSPEKPAADKADKAEKAAEGASQPARNGRGSRGRGRRGNQGSNGASGSGSGNPKQQGKTLAEVPYIRRGGQTEADLRARIVQLDQRFWMNGWLLSHPGAFQLYEKELLALNEFLVSGTMIGDVTRRQLAYQMGGDEKFFEYGSDGFKLLRSMGVEDLIRHRPMPKADLVFHAPRRRKHMRVLVTENLDPWLDVHDLMYEDGVSQILGERIHAVVLGGGMPVLEQNRLHLLLDTLGADSYEVLYWGDIDRAGLDILIKLRALLDGKFEVKPFVPAYQLMCDRAMARFPDPADNEKTGQINIEVGDTSVICDGLTGEAAAYAKAVIEGCALIPQEILTKRDL
ncbi:MAG: DUF2220 family protein [Coriobacteriia bacterium]|nr:DUF2220 family protein [Coriobacteriia bacterium]